MPSNPTGAIHSHRRYSTVVVDEDPLLYLLRLCRYNSIVGALWFLPHYRFFATSYFDFFFSFFFFERCVHVTNVSNSHIWGTRWMSLTHRPRHGQATPYARLRRVAVFPFLDVAPAHTPAACHHQITMSRFRIWRSDRRTR